MDMSHDDGGVALPRDPYTGRRIANRPGQEIHPYVSPYVAEARELSDSELIVEVTKIANNVRIYSEDKRRALLNEVARRLGER